MTLQVAKSVVAWMRYVSLAFPRRLNWTWFIGVPLRVAALAVNWALEEEPPWGLDVARAVAGLDVGLLCVKPPGEVKVKSWVLLDTSIAWLGWEDGVGNATAATNKPSAKADRRRHPQPCLETPRSHKEVRSVFIIQPHWLISTSLLICTYGAGCCRPRAGSRPGPRRQSNRWTIESRRCRCDPVRLCRRRALAPCRAGRRS